MIYKGFKSWAEAMRTNLVMFSLGFCGFVLDGLIMGTVSLIACVIRKVNAFFRRETRAAVICTILLCFLIGGWTACFVKERHYRVQAEHRADSLAYDLSKFTQMYDSTDIIVINGDTVKWSR